MKKNRQMLFSKIYDEKKRKKEISNASFSLIIPGTILSVLFFTKAIVSTGFVETINMIVFILGIILIITGAAIPNRLVPFTSVFSRFFNAVGVVILKAILVPVYLLTSFLTFWYATIIRRKFRFEKWKISKQTVATYFVKEKQALTGSKSRYSVIGSIFAELASRKLFILLPLLILLLVLGLLFFFISSSSVFSFIYSFI